MPKRPGNERGGTPLPGFFGQGPFPWQPPGGPLTQQTKFNPEKVWKNETYTVPQPYTTELRGYWAVSKKRLAFSTVGVPANVVARASYGTPLFDLRPDLRGSAGFHPEAQPIYRSSAYGSGGRLYIQIGGIAGITQDMRVLCVEEASVVDPQDVRGIQEQQDISEDFFDGGEDVILKWVPEGPIRYWRINLIFEQTSGAFPANGQALDVTGAMY